jgi:hypothetical protein
MSSIEDLEANFITEIRQQMIPAHALLYGLPLQEYITRLEAARVKLEEKYLSVRATCLMDVDQEFLDDIYGKAVYTYDLLSYEYVTRELQNFQPMEEAHPLQAVVLMRHRLRH